MRFSIFTFLIVFENTSRTAWKFLRRTKMPRWTAGDDRPRGSNSGGGGGGGGKNVHRFCCTVVFGKRVKKDRPNRDFPHGRTVCKKEQNGGAGVRRAKGIYIVNGRRAGGRAGARARVSEHQNVGRPGATVRRAGCAASPFEFRNWFDKNLCADPLPWLLSTYEMDSFSTECTFYPFASAPARSGATLAAAAAAAGPLKFNWEICFHV